MANISLASSATPTKLADVGTYFKRIYIFNNDLTSPIYYDHTSASSALTVANGFPILAQTGFFIENTAGNGWSSNPYPVYVVQTSGGPIDIRYLLE